MPFGMTDATDTHLAAQYEAYPYPERNPRDEAKRLVVGSPSHLREIDFWVFGASRPSSTPLRVLVAGGGTGDGTIMLATQMQRAGRSGRITYLDRSDAAIRIARARAEARGLANIDFVHGSLLDLPNLGLGAFDYIDCCGVLHHLPDPLAGLACLVGALAEGGGMGLMVYAPHGRTGVYMLQEAMRLLAPESEAPAARLDVAKRVMRNLPETAWLRLNTNFADHITGGDAGLYDLLLNPRDQAYTVAQFAALLDHAGLAIACLVEPMRYDPAFYLSDPKLRARAAALDPIARAGFAEALAGNISTHIAYVRRKGDPAPVPDPMSPDSVPIAREMPAPELAGGIRPDGMIPFLFSGLRILVPVPKLAAAILNRVDGVSSIAEIGADLASAGIGETAFRRAWAETWAALSHVNRLLLAPPRLPSTKSGNRSMRRCSLSFLTVLAAFVLAGSGAAHAQSRQQLWAWCGSLGQVNLSISGCTALITSPPEPGENIANAYIARGFSYDRTGKRDEAMADFEAALKLQPDNAIAHRLRGVARGLKGDNQGALADLNDAVRLNPRDAASLAARGIAFNERGEWDKAIADLTAATQLQANFAQAYQDRSAAYGGKRDYANAIADLDQVVRLLPNDPRAYNDRCWFRALSGKVKEALADCDEAINLAPAAPGVLDSRGFVYLRLERYEDAIRDYSKALSLSPDTATSLFGRGLAYLKRFNRIDAARDMGAAEKIDPAIRQKFQEWGATLPAEPAK
eukprot:gene5721-5784_t